jgi:hypothetical protein
MTTLTTWAIVADGDGYVARELTLEQLSGADFVIAHPDQGSAERGVDRMTMMRAAIAAKLAKAQDVEQQLRRMLEVEMEIQRRLIAGVHEIGSPRPTDLTPAPG